MHAISSYRGNRPTNKHIHKQAKKDTGRITIGYTALQLIAQCNKRNAVNLGLMGYMRYFDLFTFNFMPVNPHTQFPMTIKCLHLSYVVCMAKECCTVSGDHCCVLLIYRFIHATSFLNQHSNESVVLATAVNETMGVLR